MEPKKKILIVEDEVAYQRALTDKLSSAGFEVMGAKNSEEGLTMALTEHPDLILLDLQMPKMDGMTMLKNLRGSGDWGKTIPVFILTVLAEDDQINRDVTALEPTYYLQKEIISASNVVDKIKERLQNSKP